MAQCNSFRGPEFSTQHSQQAVHNHPGNPTPGDPTLFWPSQVSALWWKCLYDDIHTYTAFFFPNKDHQQSLTYHWPVKNMPLSNNYLTISISTKAYGLILKPHAELLHRGANTWHWLTSASFWLQNLTLRFNVILSGNEERGRVWPKHHTLIRGQQIHLWGVSLFGWLMFFRLREQKGSREWVFQRSAFSDIII